MLDGAADDGGRLTRPPVERNGKHVVRRGPELKELPVIRRLAAGAQACGVERERDTAKVTSQARPDCFEVGLLESPDAKRAAGRSRSGRTRRAVISSGDRKGRDIERKVPGVEDLDIDADVVIQGH